MMKHKYKSEHELKEKLKENNLKDHEVSYCLDKKMKAYVMHGKVGKY